MLVICLGSAVVLGCTGRAPTQDALTATTGPGIARVRGVDGSREWITPVGDDTFEVTGWLGCPPRRASKSSGTRFICALQVPEDVDGLRVFHIIPVHFDSRTPVTVKNEELLFDRGNFIDTWITVRFKLKEGAFYAQSMRVLPGRIKKGEWPLGRLPEPVLAENGRPLLVPKRIWLDVGETGLATLDGMVAHHLVAEAPTQGFSGSLDIQVPDLFVGVPIYHLVSVLYKSPSVAAAADANTQSVEAWASRPTSETAAGENGDNENRATAVTRDWVTVRFRIERGRLVASTVTPLGQ